jgi:hypothetical protein
MSGTKETVIDNAAAAVEAEAIAQAEAAKAIADKKTSEAVVAVAAAAEGTAALSQSVAATVVDENTKKLRTVEEQQQWLETQMGNLAARQEAMPLLVQEQVKAELNPLKEQLATSLKNLEALTLTSSPANGAASQADPTKLSADGGGQPDQQKRRATDKMAEAPKPEKKKSTVRHI